MRNEKKKKETHHYSTITLSTKVVNKRSSLVSYHNNNNIPKSPLEDYHYHLNHHQQYIWHSQMIQNHKWHPKYNLWYLQYLQYNQEQYYHLPGLTLHLNLWVSQMRMQKSICQEQMIGWTFMHLRRCQSSKVLFNFAYWGQVIV